MSIQPIPELTDETTNRPIYSPYTFNEYLEKYNNLQGDEIRMIKETFKINYDII